MKKKILTVEERLLEDFSNALEAKRNAVQNFNWAIEQEDIDFAIREIKIANLRIALAYDRLKQANKTLALKHFSRFKSITIL